MIVHTAFENILTLNEDDITTYHQQQNPSLRNRKKKWNITKYKKEYQLESNDEGPIQMIKGYDHASTCVYEKAMKYRPRRESIV